MATQYTGGQVTGQVLTAATMNSIGATWETWTPTYSASAGVMFVVTTNKARYGRIGKLVYGQIDFTITSIGTASGVPIFTAPITSTSGNSMPYGPWRETAINCLIGVACFETTTTSAIRRYDNESHLTNGARYEASFTYEAA
jgi:hypothetical protein